MTPQQRPRGDQKERHALPRHQLRQHGEHQPLSSLTARQYNLPVDHHQLVAGRSTASSTSLASGAGPRPTKPKTRLTITNASVRTTMTHSLPESRTPRSQPRPGDGTLQAP